MNLDSFFPSRVSIHYPSHLSLKLIALLDLLPITRAGNSFSSPSLEKIRFFCKSSVSPGKSRQTTAFSPKRKEFTRNLCLPGLRHVADLCRNGGSIDRTKIPGGAFTSGRAFYWRTREYSWSVARACATFVTSMPRAPFSVINRVASASSAR